MKTTKILDIDISSKNSFKIKKQIKWI